MMTRAHGHPLFTGDFMEYFNETMAKPFKWTYEGKVLSK
jgi:hypothetical protein